MTIHAEIINIDERDTHNASSSWSGYDHQGRVAIYWTLCLLNKLGLENNEFQHYSLEIENLEDFSINYKGNPFSIHQVKSYQTKKTFAPYKEAVLEVLGKGAKYRTVTSMHLHTCCSIETIEKEALKELLKNTNPATKVKQFEEYKDLLFEKKQFEDVYPKFFLNNEDTSLSFKRINGLIEIEKEIKEQIRLFYIVNKPQRGTEIVDSEENINFIYHNLVAEINKFVSERHAKLKDNPEIPFSVFVRIFMEEYVFNFTIKTAASMLKCALQEYYWEYCELFDIDSTDEEKCSHWNENWKHICSYNDQDFLLLCKKLSPNTFVPTESITPSIYRELIVKSGVHTNLIPLVLMAGKFSVQVNELKDLFVLNKSGIHHLITTIADVNGKNSAQMIGKKVFNHLKDDNQLSQMLFDIHMLITTHLEGAFDGNIIDVREAYREFDNELKIKETITSPKMFEFITVAQAKEEFK